MDGFENIMDTLTSVLLNVALALACVGLALVEVLAVIAILGFVGAIGC